MITIGTYFNEPDALVELPLRVHTHTFAIMAKKGGGKTYTAGVMEEEMARNGLPFIVIDPVGVHHGIRSMADGKTPAFPIVVFGGEHGDIPIDRNMGPELARLLVAQPISAIIDVSALPKAGMRHFVGQFADTLFNENRPANGRGHPVHLFIEEAVEFLPQTVRPDMAVCYEALERIVRLGRNFGIGISLIAQRPAQVNKDVLTQIDILIALQTVGPQDVKALASMFAGQLSKAQWDNDLQQFESQITELPPGTAFFWWPSERIFRKVVIRARTTYHAGATPSFEMAEQLVQAKPDVDAIRAMLAKPDEPEPERSLLTGEALPSPKLLAEVQSLREDNARLQGDLVYMRDYKDEVQASANDLTLRMRTLEAEMGQNRQIVQVVRELFALVIDRDMIRGIAAEVLNFPLSELSEVLTVSGPSPDEMRAEIARMIAELGPSSIQPQIVLPPAAAVLSNLLRRGIERLMARIRSYELGPDERDVLMLVLASQEPTPQWVGINRMALRLWGSDGGTYRDKAKKAADRLRDHGVIKYGHSGQTYGYQPAIETLVKDALQGHDVTDEERRQIEQQVLAELLGDLVQEREG